MNVSSLPRLCRLALTSACGAVAIGLILIGTSTALASGGGGNNMGGNNMGGNNQGHHTAAPEIDPTTASSALAFLSGSVLLLTHRLRRKG
jgi:hypothetical protein